MDRRHFLQLLGIGAVTAATPKLIFDMGKNLHLYQYNRIELAKKLMTTIDPAFDGSYAITWEWKSFLEMSKDDHKIPIQLYAKYL